MGGRRRRERERSFACRFHTFSAAMSEGTRFSFVRLLWRKAVSPTLSSLPLSYIYPGGVRVSKGTRGRSCCNFISRMRPHAPAVCLSFFLFLVFPVPFSARHDRFDFTSEFGKHISTCQSSGVSHLLLSRLSTQTFVLD